MVLFNGKLFQRVGLLSIAFILAISSASAATPFLFAQIAGAVGLSEVIYDALPSVSPVTNYPSVGFEATSTSELGDYVHLGGTNRILNTVSVTMSDWARYSNFSSDTRYSADNVNWTHPVTVNVYSSVNGVPDQLLTSKTQTISIPWRPETPGYSYNGIAFNATFDLSASQTLLPSDVIVGVVYKTNSHGANPLGVTGPYDSLNVAVPGSQAVSVGSDNNDDAVYLNSTWAGAYGSAGATGIFRNDTGWTPNGTVALKVTATAPLAVSPCTTTSVVNTTNLSTWNKSETRSAGSNQLVANGLRVVTTPSSGSYPNEFSKAAGYYTTNFKLADAGVPNIDIAPGFTGTRPSLQLGVDKDGNGSWDGYLVYEPWAYGTGNFWSTKDFGIASGLGYASFGTLDQYLNANPNARVTSIGYSLGSGVTGDAIITKITAGCTDYTFGLAAPTNLSPIDGTSTNNPAFVDKWSTVEGAAGYEYRTAHTSAGIDSPIYQDSTVTQPSRYSVSGGTVTRQNGGTPDANWYWQVRAVDSYGNPGPWSAINLVTVDTTAPKSVTLTAPADNAYQNVNNFYFTWDAPVGDNGTPLHYEFQSSQNSSQTNGVLNTNVWKNTSSTSAEQNYLATPQIHSTGANGTWYWQARAIDATGNVGPWSTVWTLNIDTSASAAPTNAQWLNSTTANVLGVYTNHNPTTPAWTAPTTGTVNHYEYSFRSPTSSWSAWESVGNVTNLGPNSFYGAGNTGTEGEWQYRVRTINNFGVASPETYSATIVYDRTNPNSINDLPALVSGSVVVHQTITDNTAPASGKIRIWKQNTDGSLNNSQFFSIGDVNVNSSNQVVYSLNTLTNLFGDGVYTAKFTSTDKAGNSSVSQVVFRVDNTGPLLVANGYTGTSLTPVIDGTTDGASDVVTVDGVSATVSKTVNKGGTYDWSYTLPTQTIGTHTITVKSTDSNGNSTTATKTVDIQSIPVAPVTLTAPATTSTTATTTPAGVTAANTQPAADNLGTPEVLGTQTTADTTDTPEVKGASTVASVAKSGFNLAWYWWALIVAAIASLIWWLIARRRNSSES